MANELILLVEDNDKNRKLVRDVLHFKGYRLAEAETGEEGVRLARELRPDLILMDIQLPGINGVTALRQLPGRSRDRDDSGDRRDGLGP
jgi:CheY-like chemotaxis protein